MSKNIILNGKTYDGVSNIDVATADGNTARFQDTSEIVVPAGTLEISENGIYDVTNYAQAVVAVLGKGGGNVSIERGSYQAIEETYTITIRSDTAKLPILVYVELDKESVETYESAKCYACFCMKDQLGVFVKSTSSAWCGTSANTNDGTNVIKEQGNIVVINSPVKLYGGSYNFIAVYEDVEA